MEETITPFSPTSTSRRYWIGVGVFIAVLLIATIGIALSGSTPTLRARSVVPDNGSTASVHPTIQINFARPVDKTTVEGAITITPAFDYNVTWEENTLTLSPLSPLTANTVYEIKVGPGVIGTDGEELRGEVVWRFTTRFPRIAYLKLLENNTAELWMSDGDGSNPQRLSAPGQSVQAFTAAPDGSALIFTVEEGQNTVNLWRWDDGARGLHRLTNEEGVVYGAPQFSPSGNVLAVEMSQVTQVGEQETRSPPRLVLRLPTDGSDAGNIYGGQGDIGHTPRWSPDGTRLAFYEGNAGVVGIYDFRTSQAHFFGLENALLSTQTWSPDSNGLIYAAIVIDNVGGAQQQVVLRDVQMGTPVYYGEAVGDQADPAWSPDGALIAYAYKGPSELPAGNGIWTMLPDGSGKLPLITSAELGISSNAIFSYPLWSPDATALILGVFDTNSPTLGQSIWVVDRGGTNAKKIVEEGYQPLWVP